MPSKLFVLLIALALLSAAGCRSNDDGGRATPAPGQQSASQPTAVPSASNASPAPPVLTAAPGVAPSTAAAAGNANADACKLLTSEEIQAVQGEGVKATKGSDASSGPLYVSQCFYETESFTNSVSLTLTRGNGDARGEGPREFWKKNFGGEGEKGEREREGGEAGEEESLPPTRVRGIGEEAYWVGNNKVGTLYVLKGSKFIRISLGGADDPRKKIEKSKTLAASALKRL